MSDTDWRETTISNLVAYMRGQGISRFSDEEAMKVLERLALQDRKLLQHQRVGYAYVLANYSDSGMSRFMNLVRKAWDKAMSTAPLQSPAQDGSAHKFECVASIKLDKDTYNPNDIHRIFQDYFVQALQEPFSCAVVQVVKVYACWYDMKFRYSVGLPQVFELIITPAWVQDAVLKPSSEFGKLGLNQ